MKFYPIADGKYFTGGRKVEFMAVPTGEFRPPKKGEMYLSGAIVAAYIAPNDLSISFHIAKRVKVERVTKLVEIK